MLKSPFRSAVLGLGLIACLAPPSAAAQMREVVSKEVSVGRSEATLRLEFADDSRLEIAFEDGRVLIDGDAVGTFEPGGELETVWRELLGDAISLEDGPLSAMLADWSAPGDLAGQVADIAQEIDRALEQALSDAEIDVQPASGSVTVSIGDESALLQLVLSSVGRLGLLDDVAEDLGGNVQVHVDEDVVIPAGSVVGGTLVVIEGNARIEGEVDGDLIVVGGELDLREGGRVTGDVRIADARVTRNQGTVDGRVIDVREDERDREAELRDELRREVQEEVRSDLRAEIRSVARGEDSFSIMAPFRPIVRGVTGVAEKLITILLLGLIGAGVLAFAGDNLDVISETARRSPGRAAAVGFAGSFLLLPVWVLGTVALAVSIIFIPVAIAWLPLFPLAAAAAGIVGYLAVARNAGEWLADSNVPWTSWIRKSNVWVTMLGGLAGLMFAFIAAHVISMVPFLGFISGLLVFAGSVITFVAIQIGFGAVLLTRAGRRREWGYDPDAAWEAAMSVDVEPEGTHTGDDREGRNDA